MAYHFQYEQACSICGKPTHDSCDACEKAFCSGCLFKTGTTLTLPCDPRNEDYAQRKTWARAEQVCLACYVAAKGHPPLVLWEGTSGESDIIPSSILPGLCVTAGDDTHSWYHPPRAGELLQLRFGHHFIRYDVFDALQFFEWLKAHESYLRKQAQDASDVLVPHARKMTEAAIRADLGITNADAWDGE